MGAFDDIITNFRDAWENIRSGGYGQVRGEVYKDAPFRYAEGRVTRAPIFFYDSAKVDQKTAPGTQDTFRGMFSPRDTRAKAFENLAPAEARWLDYWAALQRLNQAGAPPRERGVVYIPMTSGEFQRFKKEGPEDQEVLRHEQVHYATAPLTHDGQIDTTKILTPRQQQFVKWGLRDKGYSPYFSDPGPAQVIETLSNLPSYSPHFTEQPISDPEVLQWRSQKMIGGRWVEDSGAPDPEKSQAYQMDILKRVTGKMQALPGSQSAVRQFLQLMPSEFERAELADYLNRQPPSPPSYQPPAPQDVPASVFDPTFWRQVRR